MALNDLNVYWVTIKFINGNGSSVQEFSVIGLLNALKRASEIIIACDGATVTEVNMKVIQ
jgi:hypothetical protein